MANRSPSELSPEEVAALEAELKADPELAAAWLDTARKAPRPALVATVEQLLASHAGDPRVVLPGCDVLIRLAEQLAPDEPVPEDSPALTAAAAAQRCLDAGGAQVAAETRAYLQMALANALRLAKAHAAALPAYEAALAVSPERGAWWFNLGLLHKAAGAFGPALEANQRARQLLGDEKPVLWNIAICATALGRGKDAVEALQKLGLAARVAESGMPFMDELPPVQVRAATLGPGVGSGSAVPDRAVGLEALWVTPISPCHGVVSSTSQREAAIDYGDVVLWDAVPVGVTQHAGRNVPRFPLLAVLRRGDERRFRFVALQQLPGQVAELGEDLPGEAQLFIHHERVELLCARCASGEHMHKHKHEPPEEHRLVYGKLVVPAAADLSSFRSALDERLRARPQVQLVMPGLLEALGETAAAGKAHQLWRGLEQRGLRQAKPSEPDRQ